MVGSVNKVILLGNLGRDPEIRSRCNLEARWPTFSIATSKRWKDKSYAGAIKIRHHGII